MLLAPPHSWTVVKSKANWRSAADRKRRNGVTQWRVHFTHAHFLVACIHANRSRKRGNSHHRILNETFYNHRSMPLSVAFLMSLFFVLCCCSFHSLRLASSIFFLHNVNCKWMNASQIPKAQCDWISFISNYVYHNICRPIGSLFPHLFNQIHDEKHLPFNQQHWDVKSIFTMKFTATICTHNRIYRTIRHYKHINNLNQMLLSLCLKFAVCRNDISVCMWASHCLHFIIVYIILWMDLNYKLNSIWII